MDIEMKIRWEIKYTNLNFS